VVRATTVETAGSSAGLLLTNYPNPFNPSTSVRFAVVVTGETQVEVYDVLGRLVAVLFDGRAEAGREFEVTFDGSGLASGPYVFTLTSHRARVSRLCLLMR
jgi:hypothetical protein